MDQAAGTTPQLVLADDISGAAESAAAFGEGTQVVLWQQDDPATTAWPPQDAAVTVVDLHTRVLPAREAGDVTRAVAAQLAGGVLVKKVDSLLRGQLDAELAALAERRTVVLCPALPALRRTTVGGRVLVDGVPLAATQLWAAEATPPPRSVADAIPGLTAALVGLDAVRGDDLAAILRGQRSEASLIVCDAETDDDLRAIVRAASGLDDLVLAGSAALCHVLAGERPALPDGAPAGGPCVTVVGTAHPGAAVQARRLALATGATHLRAPIEAVTDPRHHGAWAERLSEALRRGDVVLSLEPLAPGCRPPGRALTDALGAILARSTVASPEGPTANLILTGGETARAVLTALGIVRLSVVASTEPGAVIARTDSGRLVGTRPGSFGGHDSLVNLRSAFQPAHAEPDPKD